jgi:hypothetical protein
MNFHPDKEGLVLQTHVATVPELDNIMCCAATQPVVQAF